MNAQEILESLTAKGARLWAEGGQLMIDAPAGLLDEEIKETLRLMKPELLATLTPQPGTCPRCRQAATLQQREPLTFWCPSCRLFSDGTGGLMARPKIPKPLTLERQEALQLLADLIAAGCGVSWDGDELRITNVRKISTALWMRFENAGRDFIEVAKEKAAEFDQHNDWVN